MSFHKGHGGYVRVADPRSPPTFTPTIYPIHKWNCSVKTRKQESTHTGCGSRAQYRASIIETSGDFTFPWDDALNPEDNHLDPTGFNLNQGAVITLRMIKGDTIRFLETNIIVDDLTYENDNVDGHVKCKCTWTGTVYQNDP